MTEHILLVDDDVLLHRSLSFNLERAGYRASTAATAVTTNLLWGLVILVNLYYLLKDGPVAPPSTHGRQLRLHPGLAFVGLIGALTLSGALGAFIVVPCMASAKVLGSYLHKKLLGLPPWPQTDLVAKSGGESREKHTPPSEIAPAELHRGQERVP